jgi:murein DD-endopeptidase MepM/ murein hydrolase activator NlpD
MLNQPELNANPKKTTARRGNLFLRQKLTKLLPPMWYNNDLDTYHIIRDRIWFLRENRFLFFTRSGPVEITLRPTTVLASAIICMVGISVIFLSTIFASYSAIEVMRDETIQTAQASNIPSNNSAQRTGIIAPVGDEAALLQKDISPQIVLSELNDKINGKTATAPKPLPSRFNTRPQVNAPSLGELPNIATANQLPPLPPIITGDGEDANPASMLPVGSQAASKKKRDTAPVGAVNPNPDNDESIIDLALAITPAQQAPSNDTLSEQMPGQAVDQIAGGVNTDVPSLALPDSNSGEYASAELENEDSFVRTAAGFAIAMLPRLFAEPDPAPPSNDDKTQSLTNGDNTATGALDDEFAITAYNSRAGPLLPSISDAARAQKMLLSLESEINYIRKSIRQLGIKTDYLPRFDHINGNTQETDFKQLLITLAEHRAALRKIPFKTPMLYFYISSEYGLRAHPKTGKKTFHHGIDLAGTWQENVRSTAPGTVVFAGREGAFGKVVRIEHDYGISTLYAHLSRITVSIGDYVAENTVIGKMGNTGRSAGAHLHYEIQVDGKSVDPSDFFTIGRQMSVSGELRQTSLTD